MSETVRPIKLETPAADRQIYDILVIDKSGSMGYQRNETINGVNTYINNLKKDAETTGVETFISVIQFGSLVERMIEFTNIREVPLLTYDNYIPGGMTALNDAVGEAIDMLRDRLAGREGDDDIDVTVTIFTDGQENESKRYPNDSSGENSTLKGLIKELTDTYKWTFSFIGAGRREAVAEVARSLNIDAGNFASYSIGATGQGGVTSTFGELTSARSLKSLSFAGSGTKLSTGYFTSAGVVGNVAKDDGTFEPLQAINTANSKS